MVDLSNGRSRWGGSSPRGLDLSGQPASFGELTVLEELENIGSGDNTNGNVTGRGHGY